MKPIVVISLSLLALAATVRAAEEAKPAGTVALDDTGVRNLRIETVETEEADFERSVFALGRIEFIPARRSGVSSRIPGRIVELMAVPGDRVEAGQAVARLESRQPGDPPPTVTLKATAGGLVTRGDISLGQPLEPETTLMEITDLSEVFATARVPEPHAAQMKPGAVARIRVASLPGESFEGTLLRFGTQADRESGTIDAVFQLPNPGLSLRPGMRAEFSIVLDKREGVMSVPRAALQGGAASRFVYVRDFAMKNVFIKTPVEVGEMNDRSAEILGGLLPGDSVVTRGAYSLSFAGAGTVSLKEALDAAHGHEHAADGSELTPEKKAEADAQKRAAAGAGMSAESGAAGGGTAWKYTSGVLFVLLLAALFVRGRGAGGESQEEMPAAGKEAA